jgi:protein gp37
MGDKTGIQWCDATWNPVVGCSIVSPGCTNCYAMGMAARIERMNVGRHAPHARRPEDIPPSIYDGLTKQSKVSAVWTGDVRLARDETLTLPLRWKRPRRIFVNSMGDLFHESVPDAWIDRVFAVMALSPQHTFLVLTKRSKRMREYMIPALATRVGGEAFDLTFRSLATNPKSKVGDGVKLTCDIAHLKVWPLPNVWLGVSAEDQTRADERIPDLLATPAAVRFVSAEPLLSALDLSGWLYDRRREGIPGASSPRLVYGETGRDDLAERDFPRGRSFVANLDQADACGAQRVESGRLSSSDVQRSGEASSSGRTQGQLDGRKSAGHPTDDGDQSRASGRQQTAERSQKPKSGDEKGKRGSCDPCIEAETQGAERRKERDGEGHGSTGSGNSVTRGGEVASSTRDWEDVRHNTERRFGDCHREKLASLNWVICGGESGPRARPMHPDWARSIRDQCAAAGVPFFFKQWGEWATGSYLMTTGQPIFRKFGTFQEWVNKASTRVHGGVCLDVDGKDLRIGADFMRARDQGKFPVTMMDRVGKHAAGRLLDGREHNDMPGSVA